MTHHYATPGVYIEELTGPGVIAGVGTNTAGFIGPALNGDINEATYITSWDEFVKEYGRTGSNGSSNVYITSPRHFYMAHAVRGFFDNGGHYAYIVRVGTVKRAALDLADVGNTNVGNTTSSTLRVEALTEGGAGDKITVRVQHRHLASNLQAARPTATITSTSTTKDSVKVDNAKDFRPGDIVTRDGTNERQTIQRIDYNANDIFFDGSLVNSYSSGTLRIADIQKGQRTFRLDAATGLYAGSVITVAQGNTSETATVAGVSKGFITLEKGFGNAYSMATNAANVTVTSHEFQLTFNSDATSETFDNLSMDRRHPRFYEQAVTSKLIKLTAGQNPSTATPPGNRPAVIAATNLAGGQDDDLEAISAAEYQDGIDAFNTVDDVNFICMPDVQEPSLQSDLITHCITKGDRFAILDAPHGQDSTAILSHRSQVDSERGFAALYYPWLQVRDPTTQNGTRSLLAVPPSGHVAGVYARVDDQRGVHKAPANEVIRSALKLERVITDDQQAKLNLKGVNVIRIFPDQARPVIWGARTTVDPTITDWIYVPIRRLMLYIEESIQEGIRWAVFEPNNPALWKKLDRTISEFLTRVWRSGALFGETADKAFYVRIDEAINPDSERALGRLYIEIGVRPSYPAEFIIVRIGLWDGGAEISES